MIVIAGLVGVAFLRKPMPFVLYATLALYVLFSWAYRFGNWFQVILPAYALLMIGVAAAADRWQHFATAHIRRDDTSASRRVFRAVAIDAPVLLLAFAVVWRFDASLATANSRNRPGDTALDRAAVLLDGPLPADGALFASVADVLALQYLTGIWRIHPDMQVVSSDQARDLIGQQPIYAVWDAAPTLAQELGPIEDLTAHVLSPDWIALYGGDAQSPVTAASPGLDSDYVEITQSLAPGVVLDGYATRLAPSGAPVTDTQAPAYDVTLRWQLDPQGWPGDLAISVRPTLDGQFIPDPANPSAVLLTDHTGPAQLLFHDRSASSTGTFADPYRLHFPQVASEQNPGFAVVLYRRLDGGFEDVARLDFPLGTIERSAE